MKLGENIYNLRRKKKMSQENLAEKIGVTRQTISNWELGETTPNPQQLKLLSKFLDISVDDLLDNIESVSEKNRKYDNASNHFNILFYLDLGIAILWGIIAIVNVIESNYQASLINLVLFFVWILIAISIYNSKIKK